MRNFTLKTFMLIFCTAILTSCSKDDVSEEMTSYNQVTTNVVEYNYNAIEVEILEDLNIYRKALGLNQLKPIAELSVESEDHNQYMISKGSVSHENFSQRASYLMNAVNAKSVSENVAYGYRTADAVVEAWLKSSSHKNNIEGEHTHFGISVRQDENGKNYFTNIFVKI